jgi:gliding motility-associated-like protein
MSKIKWASLLFLVCLGFTKQVKAQLTVDNTITVNDLVNEYLVGENVAIFNILINGVPGDTAYLNAALFNSTNSNIPIEDGIVLSSGDANNVIGPNNSGSSSMAGNLPLYNDPDLDSIASGATNDETVLEFDFIPLGEKVVFRYVFSSEEYNEFVCSSFNDAFGFFISGPGLNGPFTDNAINIAIIPDTDLPVTINTLNNGNYGSSGSAANCPDTTWMMNSEYYIDNDNNASATATQMDGFSVTLEATANVECGEMYHIKMAICDVSDGSYDSAVFLESGSFGAIPLVDIGLDSPTDSSLVGEGCTFDFIFTRLLDAEADTVPLIVSGTAESGIDYDELPTDIIFEAGQSEFILPVTAIYDEIEEGTEDLELTMKFFTCGDTIEFSASAFITDSDPLGIDMGGPEEICNDFLEFATLNANVTGGYGELQYYWTKGSLTGNPVDPADSLNPNPMVQPPFFSNSWLTVVDECGLIRQSDEPYYVENNCPIMASNIFTPNGDGVNDFFVLENLELFPNTGLKVYDRWGRLVYENNNYLNDWSPKQDEASDGTYFWVATLSEPDVEGSTLNGYITITRVRER